MVFISFFRNPIYKDYRYITAQYVLQLLFYLTLRMLHLHGWESRGLNDRVHGFRAGIRTKQVNKIYHTFLNTQPIFIKQSAHTL